jgi:hypothetical protein
MTLFQDTGGDPRARPHPLADVLGWYGAVGDAAYGNPPGFGVRKGGVAVAIGRIAQLADADLNAVAIAGALHAIGAIGNAACRKGADLSERFARMERWDIPAQGARRCERIAALPTATANVVRWQSECWDGTGFPDQLCWHGIPLPSQLLGIADAHLRYMDPEEALSAIGLLSGRAFAPATAHAYTTWFHLSGGEAEEAGIVESALDSAATPAESLLDEIADRIDEHNGVAGRWRRVHTLAAATAQRLALSTGDRSALALACRLFGSGEIAAAHAEGTHFDPLGRLGISERAANAATSAELAQPWPSFDRAVPLLRSRSEWYDGGVPAAAGILAAAIAYERLDRPERIDEAAGTQFDPRIVRELLEAARLHA